MTTRTCSVKAHTRKLRDRLNTKTHLALASEIAAKFAKRGVRVVSLRTPVREV